MFPLLQNNTVNDPTILAPPRGRAKVVRHAFALLLQRTQRRVRGGTRSPATLKMQRAHVQYLLERLPGSTPLERVTPSRIANVLEREARGRRRPLCANTLRKRASTLSQALELARGRAPRLPEIPYRYEPRVEHLQDFASYERLRDAVPADRRLWFVLATWTGQRYADVERMRREDLDADRRQVVIRSTKTKREPRWFHAAPELVRELADAWRALPPGAKLVTAWPNASSYLARKSRRLGLPTITAQRLRHTFFTWYVQANGFTPELLELGGWSDLTIPARVYAHAAPKRLQQQIERMHRMVTRRPAARKLRPSVIVPANEIEAANVTSVAASGPAHEDHASRVQDGGVIASPPAAAILAAAGGKRSVGPAGIEPATRGLKVPVGPTHPDSETRGRVGSRGERPCTQPRSL